MPFIPNRALRRQSEQEQRRLLAGAFGEGDPTVPLVYKGGYEHKICGGAVERPNKAGLGAYCLKCNTHIPMSESRRRRD